MVKCPFHFLKSNRQGPAGWLARSEKEAVVFEVGEDRDIAEQLRMIDLHEEDVRLLKAIQPLISEHIEEITFSFYDKVLGVPVLERIIREHSTVERLRQTLRNHLIEMFSGRIDQAFIDKIMRIAQIHEKIGLEPKWYMGAFQNLQNAFLDVIYRYVDNYEDVCQLSKVIAKLLNFEQQLVLDAYEKESLLQKTRLYEAVKADLKGAITKISEDLAALTEQATASVEELMASSEEVKTSFRHSVEKERETITLAQEGIVKVKGLSARIDLINRSSDIMKESVKRLDESSEQIRKIVVIVQEIADQTKLLSLNAAVEAARAGEHGRGFGVVAKEIQKLSDGTMASIKRIADVIAQSSEYTSDVISIIEEVDRQVKAGQADSDAANAVFDDIREFMSSSMDHMRLVEAELSSLVGVIGEIGSGTIKVAESAEHLHEVTKNI